MKSLRSVIMIFTLLFITPGFVAAETGTATGTVVETIESGGYVYLRLEGDVWIAANTFSVAKGDEIQYSGAMEMKNFYSKSLDRTFDSILFVSDATTVSGESAVNPAASADGHAGMGMQIQKPAAAQAPSPGEVKPLDGGQTIAGIYAESDSLKEQTVSLNAKVIKISQNIMGKNWITLQDGTGTETENKLLATSQEVVTPGDIVTVKGVVKTDVNLGYGYEYKVLLEDASFSPGLE